MADAVYAFANNAVAKRDGYRQDLPVGWALNNGTWFGMDGSESSFYLIERPKGPVRVY